MKQRSGFKPPEPKPPSGPKKKSCRVCRTKFIGGPLQVVCGVPCAIEHGKATTAKQKAKAQRQERAQDKIKRESMKSRQDWAREAQSAVNAFVRERDKDLPCISCGRHHEGQYHAGHYLSRGAHPHLAYVENNLAKQCMPCNVYLSGNQIKFRAGLVTRIGLEAVEALEADQTPRKHTIEELREIRDTYRRRVREMRKDKA